MIVSPVSPLAAQFAQAMILLATAVFVGLRFVPQRHRQRVGFILTVCYLAGIAAFVLYSLLR